MTIMEIIDHLDLPQEVAASNGVTEAAYDTWLDKKVSATIGKIERGEAILLEHKDAMKQLEARLKARLANSTGTGQ